jgi:hypothetical protein
VEGRKIDPRRSSLGQNAPRRLGQPDLLGGQDNDAVEDASLSLIE